MPFKDKETEKAYRIKVRERRAIQHKEWAEKNKERLNDYKKAYYEQTKETQRAKALAYYYNNKEKNRVSNWMRDVKNRCKAWCMPYDLTIEDFAVPEYCPVLGIPLLLNGPRDNQAQLDRIDNNKGYVKGNVCVISGRANMIKRDASIDEIEAILRYMKGSSD